MVRQRELLSDFERWHGIDNRIHLYQYAKVEVALIQNFNKAKSANTSQQVEIEGFVSLVGGRKFILRPSLAVNFGLLCDASSLRSLPTDYEFVRVKGHRTLLRKNLRYAAKDSLTVTDLERIRLPTDYLKPEISLRDAEDTLVQGTIDLPPQMKRSLLYSTVIPPGDIRRVGGLTTSLMPIKEDYSTSQ